MSERVRTQEQRPEQGLRARAFEIIFEADTPAGRGFDLALLVAILGSVVAVMIESVDAYRIAWGRELRIAEWVFTALFAAEYVVRLICVRRPLRYATSFFGIIDLLAVIPTPLSLVIPGAQSLLVVRVVRLMRIFRILKLVSFTGEADVLLSALRASRPKITVFLGGVLSVVVIAGALLYLVEGPAAGFDSIPRGMYWAIVTLTTVGYGDVSPVTPLGQAIASLLMVLGYGIIAVPTGIVSVELANASRGPVSTRACPGCGQQGHDVDATHCKHCGTTL
ncbi:MAG: ion transporter [Myxococcota bacterium]|nr:ion transporter [Myxococcota bacterium]